MEILIEFILELVLEGSIEISKSSKVPKTIRYILLIFIMLFFIVVIGTIYLTSFLMIKESIVCFILLFVLATSLLIASITKFRKTYLKRIKKLE